MLIINHHLILCSYSTVILMENYKLKHIFAKQYHEILEILYILMNKYDANEWRRTCRQGLGNRPLSCSGTRLRGCSAQIPRATPSGSYVTRPWLLLTSDFAPLFCTVTRLYKALYLKPSPVPCVYSYAACYSLFVNSSLNSSVSILVVRLRPSSYRHNDSRYLCCSA